MSPLPKLSTTTWAETPQLAAEGDQSLTVAIFGSHPQESVFQQTTLEVILEFPLHVSEY